MRRAWRRTLYFVFLIGFLVVAPAMVLYTAGYRLYWPTGRLVQTGLLSISSEPRGARILIDGEMRGQKTGATIENILPGDRVVRLEREGYFPWEKTLTFQSRETTFAEGIPLFLDQPARLISTVPFRDAAVDPDRRQIAFIKDEGFWSELWTQKETGEDARLLARYPLGSKKKFELTWSSDGSSIAVQQIEGTHQQTALIRIADGKILDSSMLPADPSSQLFVSLGARRWQWEPNGRRLLYSDGYTLRVYDKENKTDETITRLSQPILDVAWHGSDEAVFFLQQDKIVVIELDGRDHRNTFLLATGSNFEHLWTDARSQRLFFTGMINGQTGIFERQL